MLEDFRKRKSVRFVTFPPTYGAKSKPDANSGTSFAGNHEEESEFYYGDDCKRPRLDPSDVPLVDLLCAFISFRESNNGAFRALRIMVRSRAAT